MSLDEEIANFASAVMLRHFHTGAVVAVSADRVEVARDRDILLGYWAISRPVRDFVRHLRQHPHELETVLSPKLSVTDSIVRGRIDARLTMLHRLRTGSDATLVSYEPERVVDLELNRLVAWLLRAAAAHQLEMLGWQSAASPYLDNLAAAASELTGAARAGGASAALRDVTVRARPSAAALRAASRSRRQLYRLALSAFRLLDAIEAGSRSAIAQVLDDSVVAPLESWRRWELAVGLALGEALARATGQPLRLRVLAGSSELPVASAGDYDVCWQQRTTFARPYPPEPSEVKTLAAVRDYGLGRSAERPDLVVVDRKAKEVVALVEVKYSSGDSAQDRFREAVGQVVRYSRAYGASEQRDALISRSLVALSSGAPIRLYEREVAPAAIQFASLKQPLALDRWAQSLLRRHEMQSIA